MVNLCGGSLIFGGTAAGVEHYVAISLRPYQSNMQCDRMTFEQREGGQIRKQILAMSDMDNSCSSYDYGRVDVVWLWVDG